MKKRLVVAAFLVALFAITVLAANIPYDSTYPPAANDTITRYSDFPLDNIHILRLSAAAISLGGNVSALQDEMRRFELRHTSAQSGIDQQLSDIKQRNDAYQQQTKSQISGLATAVNGIADQVQNPAPVKLDSPIETTFPPYLVVLLGLNVFLLILVIILIFWLREQYYVHKETHKEDHIHPAPQELINYVSHQFEHKRGIHEIRMELVAKGWGPSIIEHAIHAAREK